MTPPRIVGVDPSLTSTGICDAWGKCRTITTAAPVVRGGVALTQQMRHEHLWDRIALIVDGLPADCELVVIETPMIGKQNGGVETLWLHGAIRQEVTAWGAPYVDVAASSLKKFACGHQKDRSKDPVLLAARDLAGPDVVHNNDEGDAWWLRQIGLYAYGHSIAPATAYRDDVMRTYEWPTICDITPDWPKPAKTLRKKKVTS